MPTYTFNNYREVFSSWEAFFSWKQPEEAPHMLVSSQGAIIIGSYVNINSTTQQLNVKQFIVECL